MEALSFKSDAAKPIAGKSAATVSPKEVRPPSVILPLQFIITGLLALFAAVGCLLARPDLLATYHYNQHVIAVTHLVVLGWICSVIMGAVYQLVPVALETKLHSERLANWQFAFHVVGFAGMVWAFSIWDLKQVGHFGSVLAIGVGLFVYNIGRTLLRVPKWNVSATAVAAALGWISLSILTGLFISAGKCTYDSATVLPPTTPVGALVHGLRSIASFVGRFDAISAMHAHAHLGSVGFFLMLIVGVSYKLVSMFTLSEVQNPRRAIWSIALLNIGLAGVFITILVGSPWKFAFALVIIAALVTYGWELAAILRARNRRKLDWSIKYFLTAIALLVVFSAAALILSWPGLPLTTLTGQLENVYGFLGLLGVVTFAILGMLNKIIPFLVWFRSYGREIGRKQVPAMTDLYSTRLQAAGYWSFLAGFIVVGVAILFSNETGVRTGCALLAAGLVFFTMNVASILTHLTRPQLKPLASIQPEKRTL